MHVRVPFLDLQAPHQELRAEIDAAIAEVLDRGWFIRGQMLEAFEAEFAQYCGVRHTVGLSNGLDALHLVLRAWDVGPGDEVIVPSHTFVATWLAVSFAGATPVPVEVDPATYTIDPDAIARAVTPRTRAVIPVHLYGQPADMTGVMAVAERHGLRVLEDAAQAHGARDQGRLVGALGHAAAFSFYPGKNLGAIGDAGGITTDDAALADRVRRLANYGSSRKYVHEEAGFNARLDEVQAAVLRVKLRRLDEWNARRAQLAARYAAALADGPVALPQVRDGAEPVWHLFVVRSAARDRLAAHLEAHGVQTLVHYPTPPHRQAAYAALAPATADADRWPLATRLANEVLSLPMGPHLSERDVDHVAAALRAFDGP